VEKSQRHKRKNAVGRVFLGLSIKLDYSLVKTLKTGGLGDEVLKKKRKEILREDSIKKERTTCKIIKTWGSGFWDRNPGPTALSSYREDK